MYKHFAIWSGLNAEGFFDVFQGEHRLTAWTQSDSSSAIVTAIQSCSAAWRQDWWNGEVNSINTPAPQAGEWSDALINASIPFACGTFSFKAWIQVPAPQYSYGEADSTTYLPGAMPDLENACIGVLANIQASTATAAEVGRFSRGGSNWPAFLPPVTVRRRTTLWLDTKNHSVLNHFLHNSDVASGNILLKQKEYSLADWVWTVSGPISYNNVSPTATSPFGSANDWALLIFSSVQGPVTFKIPGPLVSCFLEDGSTVDQSAVAPVIAAILAHGLSSGGAPLISYTGGKRGRSLTATV